MESGNILDKGSSGDSLDTGSSGDSLDTGSNGDSLDTGSSGDSMDTGSSGLSKINILLLFEIEKNQVYFSKYSFYGRKLESKCAVFDFELFCFQTVHCRRK
jgi:hypothetical protein